VSCAVAQDDVDDSGANMKTFTGNNYEERALDEAFDAIVMFWHPVSDDCGSNISMR
jgi:hypothetical protein